MALPLWKLIGCVAGTLLLWVAASAGADSLADDLVAARNADYRRLASAPPFPDDNPYSSAKADLGRMLFFDPLLSRSKTRSCATCHNPGLSWGDGLPRAIGDDGAPMSLRSPTMLNLAWLPRLGWDGRFRDIEAVTFAAIAGPANMNLSEAAVIARLAAIPAYVHRFAEAFGDGAITRDAITRERIEMALATFQRTLVSGEAPFDRWIVGDEGAIGEAAKRGFTLFSGRAGCSECHRGWAFTDGSFHDIGTAQGDDLGRGKLFPTSRALRFAFKVPTLRDVARRGPYMHDGSVPTLEAVVDLYDKGGVDRPSRPAAIHPLRLADRDKADLVAFLETLTSPPQPFTVPALPR